MDFIGRTKQLQAYKAFLEGKKNDPWVMIITGMECIGKSHLLHQMRQEAPEDCLVLYVDFVRLYSKEPWAFYFEMFERLIEVVSGYCDSSKVNNFRENLKRARIFLEELLQNHKATPFTVQANIAVNNADIKDTQTSNTSQIYETFSLGQRLQIDSLVTSLREVLPNLQQDRRLLILLDNVERLSELGKTMKGDREQFALLDTFISDIYDALHQERCFVIITSRIKPHLEAIKDFQQVQLPLSFIEESEISDFLQKQNIPEGLHNDIYQLTYGHGQCVAIFYKLIQNRILATPEDFSRLREKFYENAWELYVHEGVLRRLKTPFKEMLSDCMELDSFNLPSLKGILSRTLVDFPQAQSKFDEWEYFITYLNYPCIVQIEGDSGAYVVGDPMRTIHLEHLQKHQPSEFRRKNKLIEGTSMIQSTKSLFVGRKKEETCYREFLQRKVSWLLLIIGMTGTGKSRLLNYLIEQVSTKNLPIKLDFANKALQIEPLKILEELSWKTRPFCDNVTADTFIATLQNVRSHLMRRSLGTIRGHEIASIQPSELLNIEINPQALREKVLNAFYEQIVTYTNEQLVIMFDTCEWLNDEEDNEVGRWLKETLIPGLHERVQVPLHIVMTSRTQPHFSTLREEEYQLLSLGFLDSDATDEYLKLLAVNNEDIRQSIYRLTKGHPLCVSIIGTLLQEDKRFQEALQKNDIALMEKKFTERALIELIQERLNDSLLSPFRELTRYGVLLRSFDWKLLQHMFAELLLEPGSYEAYNEFITYSYIESVDEKHYKLHDLLREILVENIRIQEPEQWKIYHQRAYDYYMRQNNTERYYHLIALNEYKGMTEWKDAAIEALQQDSPDARALLVILDDDLTLKMNDVSNAIREYVRGRFLANSLEWEAALIHYQKALLVFRSHQDQLYIALTLKALGYLKSKQEGQETASIHDYEAAYTIFQNLDERVEEAYVLELLGDVLSRQESSQSLKKSQARVHYMQACEVFDGFMDTIEVRVNKARVLQSMAAIEPSQEWRRAIENYQQALFLLQEALDSKNISHRKKEQYKKDRITILKLMGALYLQHKKMNDAKEKYEEALTLHQQIDDFDKRIYFREKAQIYEMIGRVDEGQRQFEKARGNYHQASVLFNNVGDVSNERVMFRAIHNARLLPFLMKSKGPLGLRLLFVVLFPIASLLLYTNYVNPVAFCLAMPLNILYIGIPSDVGTIPIKAECNSEKIGVSDGTIEFDDDQGNKDLKKDAAITEQKVMDAARKSKQPPNYDNAITAWKAARDFAPNDAESQIYLEDLNVLKLGRPYVTFIVAGLLTPTGGGLVGGGRDLIQGSYVAQQENNDRCRLALAKKDDPCPLIRLLVANSGGQYGYTPYVAQQIVAIARTDSTVVGVTGWVNSPPTLRAIKILEQAHIPIISSTASSDKLTGISRYFFRINPPDISQGKKGAEYAKDDLYANSVVMIEDPNDVYCHSLAEAFSKSFQAIGGRIIETETYSVGDAASATGSIRLFKALDDAGQKHPDLIYFAGYPQDFSPMLIKLHTNNTESIIMGGDALYVPGDYLPAVKDNANFQYLYFTSFAHPDQLKNDPVKKHFLDLYQQYFDPGKQKPSKSYGYSIPNGQSILTFDAINVLLQAYLQAYQNALLTKKGVTPDEVRDALSLINILHPFKGISGTIAFLSNGDPAYENIVMLHGQSIDDVHVVNPKNPK